MKRQGALVELRDYIAGLWVVDTHEHLVPEAERVATERDFSELFRTYVANMLVSAGMPPADFTEFMSPATGHARKWALVAPWLLHVKRLGYWQAIEIALRDLFDIHEFNEASAATLSERIQAANKPGWYAEVFTKVRIARCVWDRTWAGASLDCDRELFAPVVRYDRIVMLSSAGELARLEAELEVSIHSLADLEFALKRRFEKDLAAGMVGVKSALAYARTLDFGKPTFQEADRVFSHFSSQPGQSVSLAEGKPLQDWLMHRVLQLVEEAGLPFQFHTGLQSGNSNSPDLTRPTPLASLLMEYSRVRFVLLHMGWPDVGECITLAKNFPNAHADMAWVWAISPPGGRAVLRELLETVPANKIHAFGGDWHAVEGAYGHAQLAREGVAQVLADRVTEGTDSMQEARRLARMILFEAPRALYCPELEYPE